MHFRISTMHPATGRRNPLPPLTLALLLPLQGETVDLYSNGVFDCESCFWQQGLLAPLHTRNFDTQLPPLAPRIALPPHLTLLRMHPPLISSQLLHAVKQSKTIQKGSKLPLDTDAKLLMLNDSNKPQEVNLKELIQGKKVVIFGLPGEQAVGGKGARGRWREAEGGGKGCEADPGQEGGSSLD